MPPGLQAVAVGEQFIEGELERCVDLEHFVYMSGVLSWRPYDRDGILSLHLMGLDLRCHVRIARSGCLPDRTWSRKSRTTSLTMVNFAS
jgi:hypothetical protein